MKMKTMLGTIVTALSLTFAMPAFAQDDAPKKEPSAKQLAQREKMKGCNAEAKGQGLKGDERKAFMKTCLSGDAPAAPAGGQKEKMKACNAEAKQKELKGDERKDFMKTCLSAS